MTANTDDWAPDSVHEMIPTALGAVHVRVGGRADGTPMVFWHSLLTTGSMWRYQYEHYAPTHRIVLIDAPGSGASDPLRSTITLEECSACLLAVLDALTIEKCVLVGNSWGAILGSVFAAWHPERLIAVVAANGTASPATIFDKLVIGPVIALIGTYDTAPGWLVRFAQAGLAGKTAKRTKPEFLDSFQSVLEEDPKSVALQMKSILLGREDTHRALQTIAAVPVLVIAGDEDRQFTVKAVKDLARAIPGSTFTELRQTGHLSARESPELFNNAVDDFLRHLGDAAV
jgi:3-oxoadipate enol-lactonase